MHQHTTLRLSNLMLIWKSLKSRKIWSIFIPVKAIKVGKFKPNHRSPTLITVANTPAPFHDRPQPVKLSDVTEGEFFTPLQITETMGRMCHIIKL